ncbi:hypothetical protein U0070_015271 [Myodes glareolus]|uniref:Uncharacterized protein n=1 Tax=Myodes glareolus TaxID=447135 RepID=A0AAW0K0V3_MYOGA
MTVKAKMVDRNSTIAAGVCSALFIGYCVYFNRQKAKRPQLQEQAARTKKETEARLGESWAFKVTCLRRR